MDLVQQCRRGKYHLFQGPISVRDTTQYKGSYGTDNDSYKNRHYRGNRRKTDGITKKKASEPLKTLIKIIKSTLASGEDVLVSGFASYPQNLKKSIERNKTNFDKTLQKELSTIFMIRVICLKRLKHHRGCTGAILERLQYFTIHASTN